MARINLRLSLLVAFLVVFIGWGLVADAKPIDKPDEKNEKEVSTEVGADDDADDADDADVTTRSKVQKHKKDENDCKREFHVQGACHPFHDHADLDNEGRNYDDDDDAKVRKYNSAGAKAKSKDEEGDEATIEQDILKAEDRNVDSKEPPTTTADQDVHTEGEQREINGGTYDHHSSQCPCITDLIRDSGCHHGPVGHVGHIGHDCGCCHGALGPSGACIPFGTASAGHLGTYICNKSEQCRCPNFHCSNICGNVAMGLPHPELQLCTTQDKNLKECEKTYHPSCSLVCINGNVGLSLPHPCIQLDANQTCNQEMLTHGSACCGHGHCGCGCDHGVLGHGTGAGYTTCCGTGHVGTGYSGCCGTGLGGTGLGGTGLGGCCGTGLGGTGSGGCCGTGLGVTGSGGCCGTGLGGTGLGGTGLGGTGLGGTGSGGCCYGCGRDDISTNDHTVVSGDGPNDEESHAAEPKETSPTTAGTDATPAPEVKSPVKRFDHHDDEGDAIASYKAVTRDNVLGGRCGYSQPCQDDCCHHGNEVQCANNCPNIGTCCLQGHIVQVLPHPGEQLDYHHGVYNNDCEACGCGHIHNPLPDTCSHDCGHHHGCDDCHHGCDNCHHGCDSCHHGCDGCHHDHCGHDCCHHGDHYGHDCCHHDDCCGHDCCHHKRTAIPTTVSEKYSSKRLQQEGNQFV